MSEQQCSAVWVHAVRRACSICGPMLQPGPGGLLLLWCILQVQQQHGGSCTATTHPLPLAPQCATLDAGGAEGAAPGVSSAQGGT